MNDQERADFRNYCRTLTDAQLRGVIEKETALEKTAPRSTHHRISRMIAETELEVREAREQGRREGSRR